MILFSMFIVYSFLVYTEGTKGNGEIMNQKAKHGKFLFQKYNCISCHQVYGLGGYLGPDLTTVISQNGKGPEYAMAFLKTGTIRMPDFHLANDEQENVVEYLKYIDQSAMTYEYQDR